MQPDNSDFILAIINYFEAHEARIHWSLMINSEINNEHKNKDGKLKNILSIWSFNINRLPYIRSMKHKFRLCEHGRMKQWGIDYWGTYASVVNWISLSSLLVISSVHEFLSISIDFLFSCTQANFDADFFVNIP